VKGRCASCFYGEHCREAGGCEYYTPLTDCGGAEDQREEMEEYWAVWNIYASQYDDEHTD